jgi:hypothetical protein
MTTIIRDPTTKYYALKNGQCVAESYSLSKLVSEVATLYHDILPVVIADQVVTTSLYDTEEDLQNLYPKSTELQ